MAASRNAQRHEVSYRLRLSIRYHQRRARFFDLWEKWIKVLVTLAGTSAFAALAFETVNTNIAKWIAALIAVMGVVNLVFAFSEKARTHANLVRRYSELEAELAATHTPKKGHLADINRRIRLIEADEPPTLGALVVLCQNEIALQEGHESSITPLRWYQRVLAHFVDLPAPSRSRLTQEKQRYPKKLYAPHSKL